MISKIIHFCWFGGNPLPPLALECIASWRKYLPEYEIWMWCEQSSQGKGYGLTVNGYGDNSKGYGLMVNGYSVADKVMGFDVNSIPYTAEAYKQKKFAFVSDYCRFVAMYEYGGIYFDTDVEVIKPMDDIIANGNFMGFEVDPDGENTPGKYAPRYCFAVNPGLGFGFEKNHPFMKEMIDLYHTLKFEQIPDNIAWYKTIVAYTTEMLCSRGVKNVGGIQIVGGKDSLSGSNEGGITVYPAEYFAPINAITNRLHLTKETRTIHRYAGSWGTGSPTLTSKIKHYLPDFVLIMINKIKRRGYKIR